MKKQSLFVAIAFIVLSLNSFSQVKIESNGNATVKYGNFSTGNDAILYIGNTDFYIKSTFGDALEIGAYRSASITSWIRFKKQNPYVGINRDPLYTLDVNGTIRANTTLYTSDERFKTDIKDLENTIDILKQTKGVSYRITAADSTAQTSENKSEINKQFGFIAQDFKKVYPELVYEDSNGYLSIDYVSLIPVLTEALKVQQEQIEDLKARLENIEAKLK